MFLTIEELKAQTPSQRLQFALDALEEAEKSSAVKVNMTRFHCYEPGWSHCYACLGGVAAIKAFQGNFNEIVDWDSRSDVRAAFDHDYITSFESSLDEARRGYVRSYLYCFDIRVECDDIPVPNYCDYKDGFKAGIREIIEFLKKEGL